MVTRMCTTCSYVCHSHIHSVNRVHQTKLLLDLGLCMLVRCAKYLRLVRYKGVLDGVKVEMRSLVVVAVTVVVLNYVENIGGGDTYNLILSFFRIRLGRSGNSL